MLSTENQNFQGISKEVWFMNKNEYIYYVWHDRYYRMALTAIKHNEDACERDVAE